MYVNFSDIPGHENLFLDYLYEYENVEKFYKYDFRNKENYLKVFKSISDKSSKSSIEISSILNDQYSSFESSDLTQNNIKLLSESKTMAVVTGQQLGLLGGPLYTIYKILTTIKLSRYLSERYDDYNFVPVFWLEGDDHDFNEIRSIKLPDDSNNLHTISYGEAIEEDDVKQSVGLLQFDDSIEDFMITLKKHLRETEFTHDLMERVQNYYKPQKTFKYSFFELIHSLFDSYGLVIFNPIDDKVKELLKPVFKKEILDFREHTEKLVYVSATLEDLYHAQVKVKPVNLFLRVDDGRYSIEPTDDGFKLKRKRKSFTQEELLEILENEPQRYSPNVLLRPICQDYLLPTAFYVGGPSEVSYFAQILPLYEFYNVAPPVIYPRSSATIVEKNIRNILDKQSIDIADIFVDTENVKRKILNAVSENSIDEIFESITNQIEHSFDQLKEKLFDLDKTIADSSNRYRDKIFNSLNELKGKSEKAHQKKHEVTLR
ncbi:MAG: bacillithiol biosynthesis cysteine-adding enzyme BshC, partial [Ignavibacteria bacterium]|nr:bacillithiol biosynthesis cysteine-adding enzyme BshC [Ignavibacteria bacterium]